MIGYFAKQISEIESSRVLRIYGALLSLTYAVAALFWVKDDYNYLLVKGQNGICWPFARHCRDFHLLSLGQINILFFIFAALAIGVAALGFAWRAKWVKYGYTAMFGLELIRLCILFSDFRFMCNQHIMSFFVIIAFLLIPNKNKALPLLIPFFYFYAALLKLDREWLSGAAIYADMWIFKGESLAWACKYVVVLELGFIWLLWSPNKYWRWFTFCQLMVFHLFSFPVVGFYYPVLMYLLLAIFLLQWREGQALTFAQIFKFRGPELILPIYLLLIHLFVFLQPGEKALSGEGRLLTLHMFDSKLVCKAKATAHFRDHTESRDLDFTFLSNRIRCDPIVYISQARLICETFEPNPNFLDLDLYLESHKTTDANTHVVIDEANFCSKDPSYSLLGLNSWIKK